MLAIIMREPKGLKHRVNICSTAALSQFVRIKAPPVTCSPVELRLSRGRSKGKGGLTTIQRILFSPPPLGAEGNNRVSSFYPQSLPAIARGYDFGLRGPCIIATPFRAIVTSLKARRVVGEMLNKRSRLAPPYAFRLCNSNPPSVKKTLVSLEIRASGRFRVDSFAPRDS